MKSDDLISRSKLIEGLLNARKNETNTIPKLIRFIYEYPCESPIFLSKRDIKKILLKDNVKKIKVYPDDGGAPKVFCLERRGQWIYTVYENGDAEICCSECGEGIYNKTRYCSNCGARMESENE